MPLQNDPRLKPIVAAPRPDKMVKRFREEIRKIRGKALNESLAPVKPYRLSGNSSAAPIDEVRRQSGPEVNSRDKLRTAIEHEQSQNGNPPDL